MTVRGESFEQIWRPARSEGPALVRRQQVQVLRSLRARRTTECGSTIRQLRDMPHADSSSAAEATGNSLVPTPYSWRMRSAILDQTSRISSWR
jgi:hypothetical protein